MTSTLALSYTLCANSCSGSSALPGGTIAIFTNVPGPALLLKVPGLMTTTPSTIFALGANMLGSTSTSGVTLTKSASRRYGTSRFGAAEPFGSDWVAGGGNRG